ncbi:fused DNA-binding response regulator in two-component regulatory system with GlnL: response regulator; sigma54 interaction protein [Thiomonas sp. X19]|uniref:nitrogen regulation protein NR(I) n=1 Tax=Thiomonas sp. X19 TaxID=1050370 RepID=UPI000B6761A9|nr:nitrogen regulation protein NR(I) [Thiomonas sp. X19]SCC95043.1 fused DNA-binding response regulator in two-component regulatory system with GlnL: response regulator; sigma54 interaction protein [Thiomonas sp. X19]
MKPIWIVDDDQSIRFVLEKALEKAGLPVRSFSNTREVQAALSDEAPQVLVSDIRMPGGSGIELLQEVKRTQPQLPVIIMTAYSDLDSAVSAFQSGAFEYLSKPFDLEKAVDLIRRAVDESMREQDSEEARIDAPELLGQAPAMQDVFRAIGRLSPSQVTVLITGESGSGKELVAQALHRHSPRSNGPFVAINTAAIPRDLLESELFGHERGAFTGAQTSRRGRFEQAEGGTLFLDEIGDMPYELQTRLLRVLSDGHFYRVGGHSPIKAHVRVIAATHQNLENRVRDGLFREDLFHRLNVIRLRLPALRERREDIVLLVRHFLLKSAKDLGVDAKRLSDEALAALQNYPFPGNVRELENVCHWLTVMAPGLTVDVKDLPPELQQSSRAAPSAREPVSEPRKEDGMPTTVPGMPASASSSHATTAPPSLEATPPMAESPAPAAPAEGWEAIVARTTRELLHSGQPEVMDWLNQRFERAVIQAALEFTHGRRIEAAVKLGIGRNTITRKIQDLGLDD